MKPRSTPSPAQRPHHHRSGHARPGSAPNAYAAPSTNGPPLKATRAPSRGRLDRGRFAYSAKTPFPRRVLIERGAEGNVVEIRPQDGKKHEFRVGGLPEQEVREPHLPGGANDEIGIG